MLRIRYDQNPWSVGLEEKCLTICFHSKTFQIIHSNESKWAIYSYILGLEQESQMNKFAIWNWKNKSSLPFQLPCGKHTKSELERSTIFKFGKSTISMGHYHHIPSGKQPHSYGTSPFLKAKSTISMGHGFQFANCFSVMKPGAATPGLSMAPVVPVGAGVSRTLALQAGVAGELNPPCEEARPRGCEADQFRLTWAPEEICGKSLWLWLT